MMKAGIGPCMPLNPHLANSTQSLRGAPFTEEFCFPFLLRAQNADGGWGYNPGSSSGAEPTCWTLLALGRTRHQEEVEEAARRGHQWLHRAQLPDGSLPAFVGQPKGCWVTALACLALLAQKESRDFVNRGVRWLGDTWPAEGGLAWRLRSRWQKTPAVVRQDPSLRGWSWTPGTASWVEPTSCSLILLKNLSPDSLPPSGKKRVRLAEAMLYDRMCVGGGWNSGNPLVYGVAGVPRVGPTVWALLALRDRRHRPENQKSLDWLAASFDEIQGPGSLALAHLCLEAHGRVVPPLEPLLRGRQAVNQFLMNVVVVAWAALALNGLPDWLLDGRLKIGD
jgi:hypothetical protein